MIQRTGAVIVDATCIKYFEDDELRARVARSAAAADFSIWVTALTAVELAKGDNARVRQRGLAVLRALSKGKGLLPLPDDLLRAAASAFRTSDSGFQADLVDLSVAAPGDDFSVEFRDSAKEYANSYEQGREQLFTRARPYVQRELKAIGITRHEYPADFLENSWWNSRAAEVLLDRMWGFYGVGDTPTIHAVQESLAWKLYLEAEAVTLFDRLILKKEPKRAGAIDMLQMVYLAAETRRILVTEDIAFRRAADAVIHRRRLNTRVESWSQYLSHHQ
jgi:hypothetical protein